MDILKDPKSMEYKEQEFANEMHKVRTKIEVELKKGMVLVGKNEINEEDYYKAKSELISEARAVRSKILQERAEAIEEHIAGHDRLLAGIQGEDIATVEKFKNEYRKFSEQGKDELIKEYNLSLKVGDELSLKAIGMAAAERGVEEITSDYKKRNPAFFEIAAERERFVQRFYGAEEKFADMVTTYRSIETYPEEKIPYKAGYTVLNNGIQQPYFRNKLKPKF